MAKGALTVAKVEKLTDPGRYADGGCLFVVVTKTGAKQWVARLTIHGKQTDLGLGGTSYVNLAEAREEAARLRKIARQGGDPRTERKREILTFKEAAARVHANLLPTWRSPKHSALWISSLELHVFPQIGSRPLHTLGTADVLKILTPIWTETHDTARRIKQRISTVFDWAKGAGHYPHENPVNGLKKALPTVKRRAEHRAAMSWQAIPAFMADLAKRNAVSARTLEYIILTATRSGEVRGARWAEIEDGVWTIPAERMKRGLSHRVPLSPEAIAVLENVRGLDSNLVFPSATPAKGGKAREQSVNVFIALFKRMDRDGFTTHGFRSTFRDWCSESAKADREVAEAALAHATGVVAKL